MSIFVLEIGPRARLANVEVALASGLGVGPWDTDETSTREGFAARARARFIVPEDEGSRCILEDRDRRWTLLWDGRLDDRRELIDSLGATASASDASLAALAFAAWGVEAPRRLIGDFAIARFDHVEGTLLLARDRLGIRPLYFIELPEGGVRVATSERALFAPRDVPEQPNLRLLAQAVAGVAVLDRETFRVGVRVVPPASVLTIRAGRATAERYWSPDPDCVDERSSPAEHVARVRSALEAAVVSRIRGRWPVAAQASGGLDSSSCIAIASPWLARHGRPPPLLLQMSCPGLACDESRYAASLAKRFGAPLLQAEAAAFDPDQVGNVDLGGPWCVPYGRLFDSARERGCRVVLTGEGSDELQLRHGLELEDAIVRRDPLDALRFSGAWEDPLSRRAWSRLVRTAVRARMPPPLRARRARRAFERSLPDYFTTRSSRWALEGYEDIERATRELAHPSPLRRAVCMELSSTTGMTLILQELQLFAQDRGVELVHPFLDMRVVDAFMALPARLRLSFDIIKPTLRAAMEGALPPEILWRYPPTSYVELHERAHRERAEPWLEMTRPSALAQLGLVDPKRFPRAAEAALRGEEDLGVDLAYALAIEAFLRRTGLAAGST